MDSEEFRKFGKAAVDFVANYTDSLRDMHVLPTVEPGYLQHLLPDRIPEEPEKWQDIIKDIEKVIIPGLTHWQSPRFHAYFPTPASYPSIVGELISAGFGIIGFSWITSPVCTELEVIMMDWIGKMIGLPSDFLNCSGGKGGGIIQGSASETIFICLLVAKERKVRELLAENPNTDNQFVKSKMIAYASEHSNSAVEKAGLLASVPMRLLETDDNGSLRGDILLKAIQEDIARGFIPIYVCATLGTTGTCAFDNLDEIGPICNRYNIWFHIDAAYAGAAFCCPEYRHLMSGVEMADSFNFNLHKWMLVNFDCSAMWVKDSENLEAAFNVQRIYLKHQNQGVRGAPDYRHWQLSLGRRFRSLKVWITLRVYGEKGIQNFIRNQIAMAKEFERMVTNDQRFEIVAKPMMGLICFRLKGPNSLTKSLHDRLMARKKIYLITASLRDQLFLRFVVCGRVTNMSDIMYSWNEIESQATCVLEESMELSTEESSIVNKITTISNVKNIVSERKSEKST